MATQATTATATARRGPTVERRLLGAWRRERRFYHAQGLCHVLLWIAALILVDLLVDWLFRVPGYGRVILLAINAVTLLVVLYRQWWRYLRRYNVVRVALQVERRHPELESALVSYVQFEDDAPRDDEISPVLIRALKREAVRLTQPIDFREIVSFRDLRRIFLFCSAVLLFFGALSINLPEYFGRLFYRMLNPAATIGYPTRTKIERVVAPRTVRQGDAFALEVLCSGLVPRKGKLYYRPAGGDEEQVPIYEEPGDPRRLGRYRRFRFTRQAVFQSFSYRVRIGDDESETHEVAVIPPPRVVRHRVHLRYPQYTKMAEEDVRNLNLEVPEGTELTWHLRCDRPLETARMIVEEGRPVVLARDDDQMGATVTLKPQGSFYYRFEWVDKPHGYEYRDDVQYFVQVIPDGPPEVVLLEPLEDQKATVRKTVTARYLARDDYGIADAWIVYRVGNGPERRIPIGSFDTQPVDERAAWKLGESIATLKVGDVITFAVEVADTRKLADKGPSLARSRPLRISIVELSEYLRYVFEKAARLMKETEALYQEETEASHEVKTIKTDSLAATQPATAPATQPSD